jgi:hypothetical protein
MIDQLLCRKYRALLGYALLVGLAGGGCSSSDTGGGSPRGFSSQKAAERFSPVDPPPGGKVPNRSGPARGR